MKRVARLPAEPPALAAYRASHAVDAAVSGAGAKSAWDRFRDDATYKVVRDALLKAQHGLCAYCEQRITNTSGEIIELDQQIEHVLPKSSGAGRTLDWKNFMLGCAGGCYRYHKDPTRYSPGKNVSCGQCKGDRLLEPGCDPRDIPLLYLIVDIGMDGRIVANGAACELAGIAHGLLDRMINDTLNLNCERLRRAREKALDNVRAWLVPLLQSALDGAHLTDERRDQFFLILVESRLNPDRHGHLRAFWTAERQYLAPLADTWISQNADTLGGLAPETLAGTP